jgi:hypothetical protein
MDRDFSKDLTVVAAGSGNVTLALLEDTLAQWIFGGQDIDREVHVILPLFSGMGPGIRNLVNIGTKWEFRFTVIQTKDAPMTRELSALPESSFVRAETERDALTMAIALTEERKHEGDEIAFLMAYNPASTYEQGDKTVSDYEILGSAKTHSWLPTLNLGEGLIDAFEGYESEEDKVRREAAIAEFERSQRTITDTVPATKKAVAPRKRAAKKVATPEAPESVQEPQRALQSPSEGKSEVIDRLDKLVQESVAREEAKRGLPSMEEDPAGLSMEYVRKNIAPVTASISVKKTDLAQLSEDIKNMVAAFGNVMDTFTQIIKDS